MSIKAKPFESGGGASVPDASESTKGKIQIATSAEATTGTDDLKAMTPLTVKERIDAALVGGVEYKGSYTGQSLVTAEKGDLYVSAATYSLAGVQVLNGDHIIFNQDAADPVTSAMFDKIDNTDQVSSVNALTGAVNIYADDSTLNIAGTGLSISGSGATSTLNADSASESAAGIIEIATNAEATAGSATDKALVPSNLSSVGTSQLNNDAGFITSAGVSNQITTVVRTGSSTSITAVVNALYSIGTNSATVTLPSSSLSQGDLVGIGAQGSDKTNTVVSGAISNSNNTDVASVTFTASRRGVVWFAYDSDTSKWVQLNDPTNLSSATEAGLIEIATNAEATAGSATDKALVPSNLSSVGTSQLNNDSGFITSVASASDSVAGIIEIATNAEATAGSATDKALVPSNLSSVGTSQLNNDAGFITSVASASDTTAGIIEIATNAEATAGSATDKALVPSNLSSVGTSQLNNDAGFITSVASASDSVAGIIEIATNAEATAGSATDKALVPSNISSIGTSQLNNDAGFVTSSTGGVTPTLTVRGATSYTLTAANAKGVHVWYGGTTSATFTLTLPAISDVISTATALNGDPEETFEVYVGRRVAGDITVSATDTIDVLGDGSYSYSATQTVRSGQWIKIIGWYNSASTGYQYYFMSGSSQPYDAGLQSISGLTTAADKMLYTTGSDTYAVTDLTSAGRALLDDADAAAQRTTLGLVIGTNVQAYDAGLQSISDLTTAANKMLYTTGSDTYAVTNLTSAGRDLLDKSDAAAQRTTLGLVIGTDVLSDLVQDTSPQLGGDLDLNGQDIVTTSNANLELAPDGTGVVSIKGNTTGGSNQGAIKLWCENNSHGISIKSPPHSATASYELVLPTGVGTDGQVLKTDGGDGGTPNSVQLAWVDQASGGGGWTYSAITADPANAQAGYHYSCTGTFTITLPTSGVSAGEEIRVKNMGSGTVTIDPQTQYIDGVDTDYVMDVQFGAITLVSTGSHWEII